MKCPNCGSENAETGRFCYNCGTSLTSAPPAEEPGAASVSGGTGDRTVMMDIRPGMFGSPNPPTPPSPLNLSKQQDEEATRLNTPPPDFGTPAPEPRGQVSADATGPMPAAASAGVTAAGLGSASAGVAPGASAGVAAVAKTPALAWVSLIFGVLAFLTICNVLFIPSIVAIVTGAMARGRIKKSGGTLKGAGLATAGLALGIVGVIFALIAGGIGVYLSMGTSFS